MIPDFPLFKKVTFSDKELIAKFTSNFAPYSDFNFTSFYSWNVKNETEISKLNGNLVVKFTDYLSGVPFISFLGRNNLDKTTNLILEYCINESLDPVLKLIPEIVASKLDDTLFNIVEDKDNNDYILSTERLVKLEGSIFAQKRNYVKRFLKEKYNYRIELVDLNNKSFHKNIKDIFLTWAKVKHIEEPDSKNEFDALIRFLEQPIYSNIIPFMLWIDENLAGFWLLEDVGSGFAMSHFEKANIAKYKGIYAFLTFQVAQLLKSKGIHHINLEQDLGISGLRISKESHNPLFYLKKFIVTRK